MKKTKELKFFFKGTKFIRGQERPKFVPGGVDKGTVIGFEMVCKGTGRSSDRRKQ